jgi:hypothetical protein
MSVSLSSPEDGADYRFHIIQGFLFLDCIDPETGTVERVIGMPLPHDGVLAVSIFKKNVVIPAGSTFTVSTGEYSDYSVHGVFRALKDIDPDKLLAGYLEKHPDEAENYAFNESKFLGEAFRSGLFEHVPSFDWHLCDYSRVSEMEVTGPAEWEVENA